MRVDTPNLVMVRFDSEGELLGVVNRSISQESISDTVAWYGYERFWEELDKWADEIGLAQERISVKPFYLREHSVGIKDLPDEYQAFLRGEDVGDDWSEEVQRWQDEGDFVFIWGQEYYMNREGEVIST